MAEVLLDCLMCGGTGIVVSIVNAEEANQVVIPSMEEDARPLRFGLSSSGAPCIYGPPMRFAICRCILDRLRASFEGFGG